MGILVAFLLLSSIAVFASNSSSMCWYVLQLMQTFRNLLKTDEAALTSADIDVIFCEIPELHEAHDLFVSELQPLVDSWSDEQQVAEPIKVLVRFT